MWRQVALGQAPAYSLVVLDLAIAVLALSPAALDSGPVVLSLGQVVAALSLVARKTTFPSSELNRLVGINAPSSPSVAPINTGGTYVVSGLYPVPADGQVLDGPVTISAEMSLELCGNICEGYNYLALESGEETLDSYIRGIYANVR